MIIELSIDHNAINAIGNVEMPQANSFAELQNTGYDCFTAQAYC